MMQGSNADKIRPISVYKKVNPEMYKFYSDVSKSLSDGNLSEKQNDNMFYLCYAWSYFRKKNKDKYKPFFFNDDGNLNNKVSAAEIGRLLLTGWYYNFEDFCNGISENIVNAYLLKIEKLLPFNDLEYADATKYIRDNVLYFYNNQDDFKVYLLKHFFSEQIQPLLPEKPESLKRYDNGVNFLQSCVESWEKQEPLFFQKRYFQQDDYIGYLTEILDECGIDYLTPEQHRDKMNQEDIKIKAEREQIETEYNTVTKSILLNQYNLLT